MSENVGLSTPRGSGTSGYVQKNRSLLKPRDRAAPYPKEWDQAKHRPRQPDQEILEHEAKREIEVKVFELRDKLEEEGVDEDEIDDRCDALRKKLEAERQAGKGAGPNARNLKSHQVHDLAKAKMEESERLRKALGISQDYEEGSHWRKQEERLRESLAKRGEEEEEELRREKEKKRRESEKEYDDESD
ncbi:cwf21-domain-containing protein [Aaosphaeria arxii CBS 175.79]|uniref:Cwf21-domain-containing protein n=1 Tax=Aaosphaeria arxii CBS 175.79 TaxID=1450172 RepID=A0A6A5XTX9_9PLEO|nr:cwf21-domain-containing protein [Aaosphaeria arxii CBS 175.79]KAF2016369.1 cwf21-domain-containing protein [Aaosphaeria arxii CBS 175.79]